MFREFEIGALRSEGKNANFIFIVRHEELISKFLTHGGSGISGKTTRSWSEIADRRSQVGRMAIVIRQKQFFTHPRIIWFRSADLHKILLT